MYFSKGVYPQNRRQINPQTRIAGLIWTVVYWIFILALGAAFVWADDQSIIFAETFEEGLTRKWEPVDFEGRTAYSMTAEGTNRFLLARAEKSASGIATKMEDPLPPNLVLSWRWKIDQIPPGGSDDTKTTFDHTARLFVAFDTFIGPPRTVNYVWANNAKRGSTFNHPSSGRGKFIVLETGNAKAGQWLSYTRDLAADYKLLFGDDDPPDVVAIGLMTDSDGTSTTVTGAYDDLILRQKWQN